MQMSKLTVIAALVSIASASAANAGPLAAARAGMTALARPATLSSVPAGAGAQAAGCTNRVCGPNLPSTSFVQANVKQYSAYATGQLLPGLQSWAGEPHAANLGAAAQSAAGDVVVRHACPAEPCTPSIDVGGAPSALSKAEQAGRGVLPKGPLPPNPIMPDGL
jgi:hypothetical protein